MAKALSILRKRIARLQLAIPKEEDLQVTGVMTFVVSYDGVVYQKDLGPDSLNIVNKMERYNPDKTWKRTNDED